MFRLFIVDDNKYERFGLRDSIEWSKYGIKVAGIYANGAEAAAQIEALQPHVIITDIAMPIMDGIQLSKYVKENYPNIKMIFISCHSDFEFAKSAVDLGVYGYVLKPVVSDELTKAVEKLLNDHISRDRQQKEKEKMMRQLKEMLPMVQEQFFKELLLGNFYDDDDIQKRMDFLKIQIKESGNIYVFSIILNDSNDRVPDFSVVDSYFISYSVRNAISFMNNNTRTLHPVQISNREFAAVLFNSVEPGEDFVEYESVMDIAVEMNERLGIIPELIATIGLSKRSGRLADIPELYRQSFKAVHTKFYSGSNPIILYEEIEDMSDRSSQSFEKLPDLETLYHDVKTLLSCGSDEDIRDFADKYLNPGEFLHDENYIKGFTFSTVNLAGIILMETNLSFKEFFGDESLVWGEINRFQSLADVERWILRFFGTIRAHLDDKSFSRNNQTVEIIKEIVRNRYHEPISIEDISKSLYLSARYANVIFKKETGKTIFDYLVEYRMEMAKLLLKEPDSKVASVAEAIGYQNTSYFCLAFKKNVGMTPAEYKRRVVL